MMCTVKLENIAERNEREPENGNVNHTHGLEDWIFSSTNGPVDSV